MSTAAAVITERNRANARHSTGPKTEEGKAASAQNARKHGLTGQLRLDSKAEADRFDARLAEYANHHKLDHPDAARLIREMVTAQFRMEQIFAVERTVITMLQEQYIDEIDESVTDPESVRNRLAALVFLRDPENGNVMQRLHRYYQAANRSYYRAHREFDRLVADQTEHRRSQAEYQGILSELSAKKPVVPNEPRASDRIDLSNLPWFPPEPLTVNIPPEILDMVRNPRPKKQAA